MFLGEKLKGFSGGGGGGSAYRLAVTLLAGGKQKSVRCRRSRSWTWLAHEARPASSKWSTCSRVRDQPAPLHL
jgi:hypothetical protein